MKLPNAENAVVDIAKLRDYSLNAAHVEGKHKARVFVAALTFTVADAERVRKLILAAVLINECREGQASEHGKRYVVDFEVEGLRGMVTIRSAWIISDTDDRPRLTSCYVKGK